MGSVASVIDPQLLRQLDDDDLEMLETHLNNEIASSAKLRSELAKTLLPIAKGLAENTKKSPSTGMGPRMGVTKS